MSSNAQEQKKEKKVDKKQPETNMEQNNEAKATKKKKRFKRYRTRKFPIYLRIIVVLVLLIFSVLLGLIVGYAFFGDGTVADALKVDTYRHIFDIVNKEK